MSDKPPPLPLRSRLRAGLTRAMQRRDAIAVAAFRSALAAIDNAEAVDKSGTSVGPIAGAVHGLGAAEVPRRALSDDDIAAIVRGEIAQRETAAVEYDRLGQAGPALRLRAEADVLAAPTLIRPLSR